MLALPLDDPRLGQQGHLGAERLAVDLPEQQHRILRRDGEQRVGDGVGSENVGDARSTRLFAGATRALHDRLGDRVPSVAGGGRAPCSPQPRATSTATRRPASTRRVARPRRGGPFRVWGLSCEVLV